MLRADRILFLSGIAGERVVVPTLEPPQGPRPVLSPQNAKTAFWGPLSLGTPVLRKDAAPTSVVG